MHTFCVINSGFCSGKFDFNDLVDIYNFAIIGNDENHFFIIQMKKMAKIKRYNFAEIS